MSATRKCRCGADIPAGDTLALIGHVNSSEHAAALAARGIYDHTHSYRWIDAKGAPVDEGTPGAIAFVRPGCPGCEHATPPPYPRVARGTESERGPVPAAAEL